MATKQKWECNLVIRKEHKISNIELHQRLAEAFDILIKRKCQQQLNQFVFSKADLNLNFQASQLFDKKKKGA